MSTTPPPPAAPGAAKAAELVSLKDRGNLFEVATKQIERAMKLINIDHDIAEILGQPKNELIVNFPVRRDNGKIEMFKGYRVQHNIARGPAKGVVAAVTEAARAISRELGAGRWPGA